MGCGSTPRRWRGPHGVGRASAALGRAGVATGSRLVNDSSALFGVSAPKLPTGWSCWETGEIGAYPAVGACAGVNHRSCRFRRLCVQRRRHQTAAVGAEGAPAGCTSARICARSASFALGWLGVGSCCFCRCYHLHRRPWMAERTGHCCVECSLLFRVEFEATYAVVWERH